ncbi:MAG TPA: DUF2812 domain-containing protein [Anaerolineaceae bacterium]|nr:DUF2812 domain-containing protein [Anaerolineaceae bacterium]HPN53937.1 DUF2812 domain-containing protein [Anaerolineaceae bacterium]
MEMNVNMAARMNMIRFFWHFEKEEAWLEKMALEGWRLIGVSGWGSYTFEKMTPQPLTYKIDFRQFSDPKAKSDYLALFEDSGWRCAAANVGGYNYYFYTPSSGAPKDIFSDEDSERQRHQRYAAYIGSSTLIAFLPLVTVFISGLTNPPEMSYLTPGLWQMQGWEFVAHFLFETPFVIMRTSVYWLPVLLLLAGLGTCLYYYRSYKNGRRRA